MYFIFILVIMVVVVMVGIIKSSRVNINEKSKGYSDEELEYLATRATIIAIAKKMEEMGND